MPKPNTPADAEAQPAAAEATAPAEQAVALDDFCARLSETVARPELIGGFHHVEKAAGRLRDKPSTYRARYAAFINQPA